MVTNPNKVLEAERRALWTLTDVAKYLRVATGTVNIWLYSGRFPKPEKVGGRNFWDPSVVATRENEGRGGIARRKPRRQPQAQGREPTSAPVTASRADLRVVPDLRIPDCPVCLMDQTLHITRRFIYCAECDTTWGHAGRKGSACCHACDKDIVTYAIHQDRILCEECAP